MSDKVHLRLISRTTNGRPPAGDGRWFLLGTCCLLVFALFYLSLTLATPVATAEGQSALASASLIPNHVSALQWSSIQVVFQVGSDGIAEGGGIRVQFPKSWHPWLPTPAAPQTTDPSGDYYVSAETSRPGVTVSIGIANEAIDGRTDRMDWTATLLTAGEGLVAGDVITYTFGDQAYGGRGFQANITALVEPVRIATDPEADGTFVELPNPPTMTVNGWAPVRLAVNAPSRVSLGHPFELTVSAQDTFSNLSKAYAGTVAFAATDPLAELPGPYTFTPADGGWHVFTVTFQTTGTHWITVTDDLVIPTGQPSNPIDSKQDVSITHIYWGDLHSHTDFSNDAYGPLDVALARTRDELGLDFYAVTDHIDLPTTGLSLEEWQATRHSIEAADSPGRFVAILGYEWSRPTPFGHHNVYFEGDDGPLCYVDDCGTLVGLWSRLAGQPALTIPHHTGVRWGDYGFTTVDWSYNNADFRTSIEIYSSHGQSEMYNPAHPLSYENRRPGQAWSVDGPHYARDAWAAGHRVGALGGSDNHTLQPGAPWNGLTAIYADSLDRETLFESIRSRHTYATTGERILLEFRMGQAMMGDVVRLPLSGRPTFEVRVAGTMPADWVELVRYDGVSYSTVYTATPAAGDDRRLVAFTFTDETMAGDCLYYVRMQQPDPNKPGRPAMAWSSPIWVESRAEFYLPLVLR